MALEPIPEATQLAKKMLASGDIKSAAAKLSEQLAITPDDRETHYYLCVCSRYQGDFEPALTEVQQFIERFPRFARGYQELGYTQKALANPAAAIKAFHTAVTLNDALVASWRSLLELATPADHPELLEQARTQLTNLEGLPKPLLQVRDWVNEGRLLPAEKLCRQFLKQYPKYVEGMRLLAYIGVQTEVLDDAEVLLRNAVEFEPNNLFARFDFISVLYKRQKFGEAFAQAEQLLAADPSNVKHRTVYANQCVAVGKFEEAIQLYDQVITKIADPASVHLLKAHALKTIDQTDQAILSYRAAYQAKQGFGDAFWSLANLKTYRFSDEEIELMLTAVDDKSLSSVDLIHLNFALGKHFEDQETFALAFQYYETGNALKQRETVYDGLLLSDRLQLQHRYCDEALFKRRAKTGHPAADPIFILGLPRSGSTLLEQILASHPLVEGTQELPNIAAFAFDLDGRRRIQDTPQYPACLATLSDEALAALGKQYLEDTRIHRDSAPFFIDKMPNNFRHIGLIRLILPNAKIIDARRHPMACCFSGFKQLFASGQEFSYGLEDIGRYYRDYQQLMDHWHQTLPNHILTVHHEAVVSDLEGQVRQILDFCNLEFHENCLNFHKTERSVRTPSSEQVRQPIYRSGLDQWHNFAEHLAPLRAAIGEDLIAAYPKFD